MKCRARYFVKSKLTKYGGLLAGSPVTESLCATLQLAGALGVTVTVLS